MIDNTNNFFVNYWFTNTIEDCGMITKSEFDLIISEENLIEINDFGNTIEKLNNNYLKENIDSINEDITGDTTINQSNQTVNYSIQSRYKQTNRDENKCNRNIYIRKRCQYKTSEPINGTKKYQNIQKEFCTNFEDTKRNMSQLPQDSRIYELRSYKKKVLLDSFTRPVKRN
jgi:hypothetical protein